MKNIIFIIVMLFETFLVAQTVFNLNEEISIEGNLSEGIYLSTTDKSDMEWFNNYYYVSLDKDITVFDKNSNKRYEKISQIEIEDFYKLDIWRKSGKKVKLKGILKTFKTHSNYYRQYSTPIQIDVIDIIELEDSLDSTKNKKDSDSSENIKKIDEEKNFCFSQDNFNTIFHFLDSEIKKTKEKFYLFESYEMYIDEKSKLISLKKDGFSHIRVSFNSGIYSINKSKQGNERMVKNGNTIFCKLLDFIKKK